MNEEMKFPKTFEEFIKQYSFFDKQQIYTNGSELIQVFRIKQWEEHKEKENQELKSKLELYENGVYFSSEVDEKDKQIDVLKKKYENAVADYEKTEFEKEQLNSLVNSCQEEIRQLKKQLENYKKLGFKHLQDKNNNLETQQKEFVKYLNSYIDLLNDKSDMLEETQKDILEEILQKYRSITGVSDEKK